MNLVLCAAFLGVGALIPASFSPMASTSGTIAEVRYEVVVSDDSTASCEGCQVSLGAVADSGGNPVTNDQLIECPNGAGGVGATIVLSNEVKSPGTCYWKPGVHPNPGNGECVHLGKCKYSVDFQILFAQNSCITNPLYVVAPGTPGGQPILNTWPTPPQTLADEAFCAGEDQDGLGVFVAVYADAAKTQLVGVYGFTAKCSKCAKKP